MRPIDADTLREEVEFHPISVSVCMTGAEAKGQTYFKNRCLEDIDNAPTIDAIPVEWLLEKIKEHTDDEGWQDYLANSFGLCIEEWQKKQEAR